MNDLVVGLGAAVACGTVGAFLPVVLARLPEPGPDEVRLGLEAAARERELTDRERRRLAEPPKEPYPVMAGRPGLAVRLALVAAVAGGLVGLAVGWDDDLALVLPLVPPGVLLGLVDLWARLLPALLVRSMVAWCLGVGVVEWLAGGDRDVLVRAVVGLVAAFVVLGALWLAYPPGMAYGDVRLSAPLGFVLAHDGWAAYAAGLYGAFLLFGVVGLVSAVVRRDRGSLRHEVPFGPYLLAGAVLGLLVGPRLLPGLAAG